MPDTITGNAFLDSLLERTPVAPSVPRRGQNYNYPERLYLLPDGRVEYLQGDPHNRAYYEDKGYHLMSDTPGRDGRPSEVDQYLQIERPKLLAEQREKAALINTIRRAGERYRDLKLEDTFDDYSIAEIREYLADIKTRTGHDIRVVMPKRAQAREDARDAALLAGIETAAETSIEAVEARRVARPPRGVTG